MKNILIIAAILFTGIVNAQKGKITGRVYDQINNESLPFATVIIEGTKIGATTDVDGNYTLEVEPGLYNIQASFVGYVTKTEFEIQVALSQPSFINFPLEENTSKLDEVEITVQDKFERKAESPVSVNKLGINEIQRTPGANQDISRVIQALPGVSSTPNFRNDIIIRGGGPNENKFYLDGIEIPAINHFATQGSSGGPVGLINVNFIREVDLYSSAFPVEKANGLSSVLDLKLKDGRTDKTGGTFQIGSSEAGLTLEGPLSEKTTYIASVRRSYLQFLFAALDFAFLPTYTDYQAKVKYNIDSKNQITFLGLGAVDQFKLNLDANETEAQRFQLQVLPVNEQWNYSVGTKYTHFGKKSYTNVILSRFMLNNDAFKYLNNNEDSLKLLDYSSQEIENKLRVENFYREGDWRITSGFGLEQAKYNTSTTDLRVPENAPPLDYTTDFTVYKYSVFGSATRSFLDKRINVTFGLRMDGNDFNSEMSNPLNQFAPKLAFTYNFNSEFSFNSNISTYYQLPPYTTLGFKDGTGNLVNQDMKYVRADHYVAGFTYYLDINAKLSIEGFYKDYANYPFLLRDSLTLANLGGDFGVIGNQAATSTSDGRSYGLEFLYQQKLYKGWFGTFAYTFVKSEFEDKNGDLKPSAWDNQHIITATLGKKFGKNWELGAQYQFLGGAPYTPTDLNSAQVDVFNANQRTLLDFNQLNSLRFDNFNRLNLRIDKKWFFTKWSLNLYFDIQNALGQAIDGEPTYVVATDENTGAALTEQRTVNGQTDTYYQLKALESNNGSPLPGIGIIINF